MSTITTLASGDLLETTSRTNINNNFSNLNTDKLEIGGTNGTPARGDILVGKNASPTWEKLTLGSSGKILRSDGTDILYSTVTIPNTVAIGSILATNTGDALTAITSSSGLKVLKNDAGTISWNAVTGTGDSVLAISPTLVTPALGTPASGVLTNCTGLPTTGLVDDAVTLAKMAAGTAGNLITYDASGNPAAVATGTAGQVLTSNGAGAAPTFQAASGGSTLAVLAFSTMFETAGRFTSTVTGGGAFATFATSGVALGTGATGGHSASVTLALTSNATTTNLFNAGAKWSGVFRFDTKGTTGSAYFGIGTVTIAGSGHTFTDNHIGFKVVISGSTATISATVANGTTETSTSMGTITTNDSVWMHVEVISTASVKFYLRVTSGAWSSATEITTNIPTATTNILQVGVSNDNTATASRFDMGAMSYSQ